MLKSTKNGNHNPDGKTIAIFENVSQQGRCALSLDELGSFVDYRKLMNKTTATRKTHAAAAITTKES